MVFKKNSQVIFYSLIHLISSASCIPTLIDFATHGIHRVVSRCRLGADCNATFGVPRYQTCVAEMLTFHVMYNLCRHYCMHTRNGEIYFNFQSMVTFLKQTFADKRENVFVFPISDI